MTELNYLGAVDLTQYFVKSYSFSDADEYLNKSTNGNKGARVDFIFSRRLLNQVLTVFMPTVYYEIICIISQPDLYTCVPFSDCYCSSLLLYQLFQGTLLVFSIISIQFAVQFPVCFSPQTLKPMSP